VTWEQAKEEIERRAKVRFPEAAVEKAWNEPDDEILTLEDGRKVLKKYVAH
jgi:hypothetical protein